MYSAIDNSLYGLIDLITMMQHVNMVTVDLSVQKSHKLDLVLNGRGFRSSEILARALIR